MNNKTSVYVLVGMMIASVLFVVTWNGLGLDKKHTDQASFFTQLSTNEIIKMRIESDFTGLIQIRNKKIRKNALLSLETEEGLFKTYPIEINLRGKSRLELCDFPPLKLRFSEPLLSRESLNQTFDDYKLVTHCINDSEAVLKEFLAYQLYNQLTDYSFQVHLLEVTYIDQSGAMQPITQYGFLIEKYSEMAARLSAQKMSNQLLPHTKVPVEDYQRLALFQYMIGNTDWNLYRQHNIKWLRIKNVAIPVPYDFDGAGLVNASYAKPHPSLPIATVRERYLQWRGNDQTQLANMQEELRQKQADLIQTCQQFQALSGSGKAEILSYLNEFFSMEGPMVAAK